MAAPTEVLEWRQARQWLINSEVIPPTHRVTKPDVDLVDFARSLRDGVFLCSLLNKLKPNCVEDWSPKPLMQHSYLRNISSFLQACRRHFNIQEKDLFMDSDLYDVDNFRKVMQLLSKLSHTPEALSMGWVPFPRKEHRNYYNQPDEENIYASLQEVTSERLYANVWELYDKNPDEPEENPYSYGNESIYDTICYYQAPPVKTTDADEKKAHVLEELFATEKSFVRVLELICKNFYHTLRELISLEDCRLMFDTAQLLYPVHCSLLEDLEKTMDQKHDSGRSDVTQYFLSHHTGLLHYGQYAVRLPQAVEKAKMFQNRGETARVLQVCQQTSEQRFPLSDLLHVPIQRVLKYPLLMKDLLKCAKKQALPSQSEVNNLERVIEQLEDLAKYINSTKGDAEHMKQIEEVEQSFAEPPSIPLLQCGRYRLDGELKVEGVSKKSWVFLFDKAMLMCRKTRGGLFDQRYAPKQVYQVAQLRVEPIPPQAGPKGGKSFGFRLFVAGNSDLMCYTKTEEMKCQWIDAINGAREVIAPRDRNKGNHSFELTTFDEACLCDACDKLLYGCYFQGYYCQVCKRSAHKDCLKDVRGCSTMQPPALPPQRQRVGPRHSVSTDTAPKSPAPGFQPRRGASLMDSESRRSHIYVAKQRYDAIGNRKNRVLSFEKGEELEVQNPVPGADWWEAISLKTGSKGEVPSNYLIRKLDDPLQREEDRLKQFPWFIGKMSRIEAEQCLHRMKDGVFLIRESDARRGEYAIALRWNRMPKHIKVCKHPDTRKFYVSDVCDFHSVWELVDYYQVNSLGASFPGVDTTLKYPYKEVDQRPRGSSNPPPPPLPPSRPPQPLSSPLQPPSEREQWAEAMFSFTPEYPDEMSIEKHDHVLILEKETNKPGWWYGNCNGRTGLFPSNYVRELT